MSLTPFTSAASSPVASTNTDSTLSTIFPPSALRVRRRSSSTPGSALNAAQLRLGRFPAGMRDHIDERAVRGPDCPCGTQYADICHAVLFEHLHGVFAEALVQGVETSRERCDTCGFRTPCRAGCRARGKRAIAGSHLKRAPRPEITQELLSPSNCPFDLQLRLSIMRRAAKHVAECAPMPERQMHFAHQDCRDS